MKRKFNKKLFSLNSFINPEMNSRIPLGTQKSFSVGDRQKQSGIQLTSIPRNSSSLANPHNDLQSRQANKPNRWRACQYRDTQNPNYYCVLQSDCNYLYYCNAHYVWHQNMERFEDENRMRMKLNQEIESRKKIY